MQLSLAVLQRFCLPEEPGRTVQSKRPRGLCRAS